MNNGKKGSTKKHVRNEIVAKAIENLRARFHMTHKDLELVFGLTRRTLTKHYTIEMSKKNDRL